MKGARHDWLCYAVSGEIMLNGVLNILGTFSEQAN